jgi:hypothetical protein
VDILEQKFLVRSIDGVVEKATPQTTGVGGGQAKKKKCGAPQKVKILIAFFPNIHVRFSSWNLFLSQAKKKKKKVY